MKSFLFITPYAHTLHPALGIGYLASYVSTFYPGRYRFYHIDYALHNDSYLEIVLQKMRPECIGITATTHSFPEATRIAHFIKNLYNSPIILGGPHIACAPHDIMDSPFDIGIIGEGEETFLELLQNYDKCGEITSHTINGVALCDNHTLIKTEPRALIANLDTIPTPDYSLFAMKEYYAKPRMLSPGYYAKGTGIMPSRGCSHRDCQFPQSESMWHNQYRSFSAQRVFSEIKTLLATYNLNSILFFGDMPILDKNWLPELADHIKRSDFASYLSITCESIPSHINDERAVLLRSMGCDRIEFTFVKNPRTLMDHNKEVIDICHRHNIKVLAHFIIGLTGESVEEIQETIDFINEHEFDFVTWSAPDAYSSSTISSPKDRAHVHILCEHVKKNIHIKNTHIIHRRGLDKKDDMSLVYETYKSIRADGTKNPLLYVTDYTKNKEKKKEEKETDSFINEAEHYLKTLATAYHRLYYRDHTPQSLEKLYTYIMHYNPTVIVQLGTRSGLSLRALIAASSDARIVAIDKSFKELYKSKRYLPLNLSRVILIEKNILDVDFAHIFNTGDRVVIYLNIHGDENNPIMEYMLTHAFPRLPAESLVIINGVWHCSERPMEKNISEFFYTKVFHEIDPLGCFEGAFASYGNSGFFLGSKDIIKLTSWINHHAIEVLFDKGDKLIAFHWPHTRYGDSAHDDINNDTPLVSGTFSYHPLICCGVPVTDPIMKTGMDLYRKGEITKALQWFLDDPTKRFAHALCYCRLGIFEKALPLLKDEEIQKISPFAGMLVKDIEQFHGDQPMLSANSSSHSAITLFTVPQAFHCHMGIIQRNAITSWTLLSPKPEIILLGDDEGCADVARELNIKHIPDISSRRVDEIFKEAQDRAENMVLAFVQPDVILMNDFMNAVKKVIHEVSTFLMIGQHWDVPIDTLISFENEEWEAQLRELTEKSGKLHSSAEMDYFIFSKNLYKNIPPFSLTQPLWDNWLVYKPIIDGNPVIDVTRAITAVHQHHEHAHINKEEMLKNKELAGSVISSGQFGFPSNATWELTDTHLKHRPQQLAMAASLRQRVTTKQ
ncbi:MAG: B12-binding domain-containing radical SAM protein [bacterium]